MNLDDVLAQGLLCHKQFAALSARDVTDVLMHLDVVIVATAVVRDEAAETAAHHWHLTVHHNLVPTEQVRCKHTKSSSPK